MSSKKCNLKFYPKRNELEGSSHKVDEEEEVARWQNEEDFRHYGSRSEPMDVLEMTSDAKVLDSPTKDSPVNFAAAFNERESLHKTGNFSESEKTSIYSNEHAKVSPLTAWLTESALPSVTRVCSPPLVERVGKEVDSLREEIREIENFRNVHLASDLLNDSQATETSKATDAFGLELPSQIYYRNILDRYPLLPTYLARRLAEANSNRAERLFQQRVGAIAKVEDKAAASDSDKTWRSSGPFRFSSSSKENSKRRARDPFVRSTTQTSRKKPSDIHMTTSPGYNAAPGRLTSKKQAKVDKKRANSHTSLSNSQPQYDYWNGGSPLQRTNSVGSRSSSRNSSLHGSAKFYDQKQYQYVDYFASHTKSHWSPPSLPPPPVKLGKGKPLKRKTKKLSFDCDICGKKVNVVRRRQWQYVFIRMLL